MLALYALTLSLAHAQDTGFAGTAPAETADKAVTTLSTELGGTYTSGNAVYYTLNGTLTEGTKWSQNKVSTKLGVALGKGIADANADAHLDSTERAVGMVENARKYYADLRYDRFFGTKDSLYVLGGALIDPFAGYDLRTHEQLGYSRVLTENDTTKLLAEIGADYAQENYVDGVVPNTADIMAARLMLGLNHKFNESVSFDDTLEAYENVIDLNDVRVLNTASFSAALSTKFSLKVSHALTFDNVPVEGFEPLDQTTLVTFVASLL